MKKPVLVLAIILLFAASSISAHAHCPLCTAAVGTAAVSAKYLGVDTTVIGLLIGAFGVSTGLMLALRLKNYFKFQFSAIVVASFLLTVVPLMYISDESIYFPALLFGASGSALNKVYWVNKILLGSVIGGIASLLAYIVHVNVKRTRGKVLFPFQGIVFTMASLLVFGMGLFLAFR